MTSNTPQAVKTELRHKALAERGQVFERYGTEAARNLVTQVLVVFSASLPKIIAGYWPIGSEIDIRPTLNALHQRGCAICLPVAGQRGYRLLFRRWIPGDKLESGPFGTFHPTPAAPPLEPVALLVPLLAFDNQGNRLGYGAGFYDRTLAQLRASSAIQAWGVGFDQQEVPNVPVDSNDERLDGVITDKRLLTFAPTS